MEIEVDLPGAWFLLPLRDKVVADPDEDDGHPRYRRPPRGGWQAVGDAVLRVYNRIQDRLTDPGAFSMRVELDRRLSKPQLRIVDTWFCLAEAPQLDVVGKSWTNGRHRSWGLRTAGFEFAPVLLEPLGDAIRLWEDDPLGWGPLDAKAVSEQRSQLALWRGKYWGETNPHVAARWQVILDRWETRLQDAGAYE